jgi:hypothetical protein
MISIVPATAAHIEGMVGRLRPEVLAELAHYHGLSGRAALELGLQHSVEAWTALDDAEPVAMWGVTLASLLGDVAHPWVITTTATDRHKVRFWRQTKLEIARMLARWPVLSNEFDSRDGEACRILRRLGFTLIGGETPLQTFTLARG